MGVFFSVKHLSYVEEEILVTSHKDIITLCSILASHGLFKYFKQSFLIRLMQMRQTPLYKAKIQYQEMKYFRI